jgi:hypothetical protein
MNPKRQRNTKSTKRKTKSREATKNKLQENKRNKLEKSKENRVQKAEQTQNRQNQTKTRGNNGKTAAGTACWPHRPIGMTATQLEIGRKVFPQSNRVGF